MCFVALDLNYSYILPILDLGASNSLKLSFRQHFLTDVINYCEERKIKVLSIVCAEISRNLGSLLEIRIPTI